MSAVQAAIEPTPSVAHAVNVLAKAALVGLLLLAVAYPESGNMQDKAAGLRAVGYPLMSFTVPVVWWPSRRSSKTCRTSGSARTSASGASR